MTILLMVVCAITTVVALWKTISLVIGSHDFRPNSLHQEIERLVLLQQERDKILQDLRLLELEYDTNSVSKADFLHYRRRYESAAMRLMQEIEGLRGGENWQSDVDDAVQSFQIKQAQSASPAPSSIERKMASNLVESVAGSGHD